ncbi:helix-turn-helix domain-containing protein [Amycolatopsis thermalba]|uniref:helix-turn-helix domain-containing protein n=1 Tax=Amycolatopsis thermalba TaxID=944492 RepID=UPI000E231F71
MNDPAGTERCLHVAQAVAAPPDGSDVGAVIRWYRQHRNLSQQEAAALLNTTQPWVSKVEKGKLVPGLAELRSIATKLHIPPERLGHLPDHSRTPIPKPGRVSEADAPQESQEHWKLVQRELNANRARLGDLASGAVPAGPPHPRHDRPDPAGLAALRAGRAVRHRGVLARRGPAQARHHRRKRADRGRPPAPRGRRPLPAVRPRRA